MNLLKRAFFPHLQAKQRKKLPYSRARSTITRIETSKQYSNGCTNFKIREQDPLKQGLNHLTHGTKILITGDVRESEYPKYHALHGMDINRWTVKAFQVISIRFLSAADCALASESWFLPVLSALY